MIRVLLADDHMVVRRGIRYLLEEDPQILVQDEASDGQEAWDLLDQRQPDMAILDIRMPGISGIELTKRIKTQFPNVRVLILTAYDDEPYVSALLNAGADGYVLKTASGKEFMRAIKAVAAGENVLDLELVPKMIGSLSPNPVSTRLSSREVEVLRCAAKGRSNREIGEMLEISVRTVQGHLVKIFSKLHVASRTEAVIVGLQQGLITLEDTQV